MKVLPSFGMLARRISPPSKRRQFAADGQAQAGAAIAAAGAGVGLMKRLEDNSLLVRRNADSGIAHLEGEMTREARLSKACSELHPVRRNANAET